MEKDKFLNLLEIAKKRIIEARQFYNNGFEFETALFHCVEGICEEKGDIKSEHRGQHAFPDIVVENFGLEAKLSNNKNWKSTGNSVTETTKIKAVSYTHLTLPTKRIV